MIHKVREGYTTDDKTPGVASNACGRGRFQSYQACQEAGAKKPPARLGVAAWLCDFGLELLPLKQHHEI